MRLVLLIAVIALVVDAFYFSGAYTQSAVRQLSVVAERVEAQIRNGDGSADADRGASEPAKDGRL